MENQEQNDAPKCPNNTKSSFTRRKLLVVIVIIIVIIGTLIALLLPVVRTLREAARRMTCSGQLKQIAVALHSYHDTYHSFPPAYTVDEDGYPLHSWRVLLLPFLEENDLYKKIRLDEPWNSEHNRQFHRVQISRYRSFQKICNTTPEVNSS